MEKVLQAFLAFALLFAAGPCVADIPTGEELFEQQQGGLKRPDDAEVHGRADSPGDATRAPLDFVPLDLEPRTGFAPLPLLLA